MKTITRYSRSVTSYKTYGSVLSTEVHGDSLQQLEDELNKFIKLNKKK